jgi:hypothetical protein
MDMDERERGREGEIGVRSAKFWNPENPENPCPLF